MDDLNLFKESNGNGSERLPDSDFNFGHLNFIDSQYDANLDLDSSGHTTVESCHRSSHESDEDLFPLDDGFSFYSPLTQSDLITNPTFWNDPPPADSEPSYRESSLGWFREDSVASTIDNSIFSPDSPVSPVVYQSLACSHSSSRQDYDERAELTNQAPCRLSYNERKSSPSINSHGIVAMNTSPAHQDPIPRLENLRDCSGSPSSVLHFSKTSFPVVTNQASCRLSHNERESSPSLVSHGIVAMNTSPAHQKPIPRLENLRDCIRSSSSVLDFSKTSFPVVTPASSTVSDSDSVGVMQVDCKVGVTSRSKKKRNKGKICLRKKPKAKPSPKTTPQSKKTRDRRKDPLVKQYVQKTDRDVLLGRGGGSNHHPGNQAYRKHILELQPKYKGLTTQEKTLMSKQVVDWVIHQQKGRFLKRETWTRRYFVATEAAAREKASQALREDHTPEGRALKKSKTKGTKGGKGCRNFQG